MAVVPRQAPPKMPPMTPEFLAYNNKDIITIVPAVFTALAFIVTMMRVYVRAVMLRVFGVDDYLMVISMAISVVILTCTIIQTNYGLGKHFMAIDMADTPNLIKWFWIQAVLVVAAISLVKLSIGFFLLRLSKKTLFHRFIWALIIFNICFMIACLGTIIFQCNPIRAAFDFSLRGPPFGKGTGTCYSMKAYKGIALFNSVINIITDVLFATLPIPLIVKLQVNTRTKVSLVMILSLGFFACAAAIVKAIKQMDQFKNPDWTTENGYNLWASLELNIGIITASLAAVRPLFAWLLDTARALTTGSGSQARTGASGYTKRSSLGYIKTKDSNIAMGSLQSRSDASKDPYHVQVDAVEDGRIPYVYPGRQHGQTVAYEVDGRYSPAGAGKACGLGTSPDSSDECILPLQRPPHGIVRTTEVQVTKS